VICATAMLVWAVLATLGFSVTAVRVGMGCVVLAGFVLDIRAERRKRGA
jgi:hypothetical protein